MLGTRVRALGLYAALSLPLAALVHVGLEVATSAAGFASIATPRHESLLFFVVLVLTVALRVSGLTGDGTTRRRHARLLAAALPERGTGARFFIATLAGQFAFVVATMLIEGTLPDPAASVTAFVGAAAALGIASLFLWLHRARIVGAFEGPIHHGPRPRRYVLRCDRPRAVPRSRAAHFALFTPNRPPPHVLAR